MDDGSTDRTRIQGVEFGPLKQALREQTYPVTASELIEQYGGFELEFPGGSERVEGVLNRVDDSRFHEPREIRDALLAGVDDDSITREGYTDYDPETAGTGDWSQDSL